MYTIVPFRSHRELSRPVMNPWFDDRFFRNFFDMGDLVGQTGFRVDVKETENGYHLEAELPGVKQEDVHLTVDNDVLTISAEMNSEKKEEKENYLYSERRSGHVSRSFSLEGIAQDDITATYLNGVLTVTLPKAQPTPEKQARTIAITDGTAA